MKVELKIETKYKIQTINLCKSQSYKISINFENRVICGAHLSCQRLGIGKEEIIHQVLNAACVRFHVLDTGLSKLW